MRPPTLAKEGMRYWRLEPDARLRAWVHCYWWVEPAPDEPASNVAPTLPDFLLPDGQSELVFRLSGEFTRWELDATARTRMNRSYVIGGRAKSVLTQSPGGLRLAGVKLEPRALRSLLGMPLDDFRDNTVAFTDLGARALLDLEDELANVRDVDRLVNVLDRFFLRRLDDNVGDEPAVGSFLARIRTTHGAQPILEWARQHRICPRTLERRFVARMGMTPKQFARIERFQHAYRLWSRRGASPVSTRAHLDGYYDESHFDREFRHFLGASPLTHLRQHARFTTTIAEHLADSISR